MRINSSSAGMCLAVLITFSAVCIVMPPADVSAQSECRIGAFANEEGEAGWIVSDRDPDSPFATFDVYYVLFTEDFVNAVAWNREVVFDSSGYDEFLVSQEVVPAYGTFLEVRDEGFRVGIGTCVVGFGGVPITVMKETFGYWTSFKGPQRIGWVNVLPNVLENVDHPVYNTCNNVIRPCEAMGNPLYPVSSESTGTWGRVKALYGED